MSCTEQNYLNHSVFPVLRVLNNPKLLPDHPSMIGKEKSKIILNFFIDKGWMPIFEPFLDQFHNESNDDYQYRFNIAKKQCDEYNSIFEIYYEKRQLEKKLLGLGLTYDDLSNAAVSNVGKVSYDFLV